jgi:ankyrin repeat protein
LSAGANPADRLSDPKTAAGTAASMGNDAVLALLLAARADTVAQRDSLGRIPLHWAAECGATSAARMLLGADPSSCNAADLEGATPLLLASRAGHWRAVEALLEAGAALRPTHRASALVAAAQANRTNVMWVILARAEPGQLRESLEEAMTSPSVPAEAMQALLGFVHGAANGQQEQGTPPDRPYGSSRRLGIGTSATSRSPEGSGTAYPSHHNSPQPPASHRGPDASTQMPKAFFAL